MDRPKPKIQPRPGAARKPSSLTAEMVARMREGAADSARRAHERRPPITAVLPVPRAVTLAGHPFLAIEFQLRDLAELQAWVEEDAGHPLDAVPEPDAADPGARRVALARAFEVARAWPPKLGTEEAARRLATPLGRAFFLTLCLVKCQPFAIERALELLPGITPPEWRRLRRVAYAVPPWREILDELDPDDDDRPPTDWCEAANAAHEHRGVAYRDLGELYLSQWRNIHAGGKHSGFRVVPRRGESLADATRRVRAALEVPEPETPEPGGTPSDG